MEVAVDLKEGPPGNVTAAPCDSPFGEAEDVAVHTRTNASNASRLAGRSFLTSHALQDGYQGGPRASAAPWVLDAAIAAYASNGVEASRGFSLPNSC